MERIVALYKNHEEVPYISPERDVEDFLEQVAVSSGKLVPKRNMVRTAEGYLPGHIIILWRVQFGTYTNDTVISKYFEYMYGINAKKEMEKLLADGLVIEESAKESIDHLPAGKLKLFLKEKGVKGLSKMKRDEVDAAICEQFSEEELGQLFTVRGYRLSEAGQKLLDAHPEVIERHPKKKI